MSSGLRIGPTSEHPAPRTVRHDRPNPDPNDQFGRLRQRRVALERPRDVLNGTDPGADLTWFLGTVRPDGRPHAAGVGATWLVGNVYFVSGPGTRKSRDLAANPACTLSVRLEGIDLVFEGGAKRVTDATTLNAVAARYRAGGWPAEAEGAAFTAPFSAPSAGPPPWHLYRLDFTQMFGVAGQEPHQGPQGSG